MSCVEDNGRSETALVTSARPIDIAERSRAAMPTYQPIPFLSTDQQSRFWSFVNRGLCTDCWPWLSAKTPDGYGIFVIQRRSYRAHRVSYAISNGGIDSTLTIDHLCRNRMCVNPSHLEQVTAMENILRSDSPIAVNALATHCVRGHLFDADNTRIARGNRVCITCASDNWARHGARWTAKECRSRELCVRCRRPSATYRCAGCRGRHNSLDRSRKR